MPEKYYQAFDKINHDKNNYSIVAEKNEKIIGCLQLTIITYLTYQGGKSALIEGVRIDSSCHGEGIGQKMFEWAIQKAKDLNCHVVQLTTDKNRPDALAFYQKLGFVSSHEGMKLHL